MQTPGADEHDNSISYSWCVPLPTRSTPTAFTMTLFLASLNATDGVFVEGGYVYIDSTKIKESDKCVLGSSAADLKALAAKGVRIAGTTTAKHHK